MTAPISDTVTMTLTEDTVGISARGFGTMALLSYDAPFSGVRVYGSYADVATDFGAGTFERLAASALFGQTIKPKQIKVYAANFAPTQKATVDVLTVRDNYAYTVAVQGPGITATTVTHTSAAAATSQVTPKAAIHAALVDGLNAVVGNNYLAAYAPLTVADFTFTRTSGNVLTKVAHGLQTGDGVLVPTSSGTLPAGLVSGNNYYAIRLTADTFSLATSLANALAGTAQVLTDAGTGTHTLADAAGTVRPSDPFTVTADSAGAFFSLAYNHADISLALTHVDPGIEDDLDALLLLDNDWYALGLLGPTASTDIAIAAATWIEANDRLYFGDTSNGLCASAVVGGGGNDIADRLHSLSFKRSCVVFHPDQHSMPALRLAGRYLPKEPGSTIAKFRDLAGVVAKSFTATERVNLRAKCANWVEKTAGITMFYDGRVSKGGGSGWLDVTRDLDFLQDRLQTRVFGALASADRITYDDEGFGVIEAEMLAGLAESERRKIIASGYVVTMPLLADIADGDKANRHLPDVKWSAVLRGAVQSVAIDGTISL